jgi:hypothetical protein
MTGVCPLRKSSTRRRMDSTIGRPGISAGSNHATLVNSSLTRPRLHHHIRGMRQQPIPHRRPSPHVPPPHARRDPPHRMVTTKDAASSATSGAIPSDDRNRRAEPPRRVGRTRRKRHRAGPPPLLAMATKP